MRERVRERERERERETETETERDRDREREKRGEREVLPVFVAPVHQSLHGLVVFHNVLGQICG